MHFSRLLTLLTAIVCFTFPHALTLAEPPETIDIGTRLEMFVDDYLIEKMDGASLKLNNPRPAETVLKLDRPWEGPACAYFTVIKDGPLYRMYYRGGSMPLDAHATKVSLEVTCYADSLDGIHWHRPNLGLHEYEGSRDNNIILMNEASCHNFAPFLDERPGVPAEERFKAFGGAMDVGLIPWVSGDGIHWRKMSEQVVISKGKFDSQNIAFWSAAENCYVSYFRDFKKIGDTDYRWIARTTSKNFTHWTDPVLMDMGDVPPEHFYTNQTVPYFRAPHQYLAICARFMPGKRVISQAQAEAVEVLPLYASECSDAIFMSSRGGNRYNRTFLEAFLRPGYGPQHWTSRNNYPARGVVPVNDEEISFYVQRRYMQPAHYLQRCTLLRDRFGSVHGPYRGGEMVTRPLVFTGKRMFINFSASAAGSVKIEFQDLDGRPIPGYTLEDCFPLVGDDLERLGVWNWTPDISKLAGRPVRLRFVLKDADVYAIQFKE